MTLTTYSTAAAFLEQNQAPLEQEEAVNNLMLGTALVYQKAGKEARPLVLLSILEGSTPIFCALQTPPRNLIVYGDPLKSAAIADLVSDYVVAQRLGIPGLLGARTFTESMAQHWGRRQGVNWTVKKRMGVYRLEALQPIRPASGYLRLAKERDQEVAIGWTLAFGQEAMGESNLEQARLNTAVMIRESRLYFWEDNGTPVSMAAVGRPTEHGIAVYYVYTPPEYRGRGYASNAVARMSAQMLARGRQFCMLFTDLNNPTSNKIYREMGYYKIEEFVEITSNTPQLQ
ncbi:MAG TPA: GNAT family N-acetyltransferase [Saprospiraceae bacterium]|nr:GNAT family N-acetyltransferase [Saprospiraceae bacterium]